MERTDTQIRSHTDTQSQSQKQNTTDHIDIDKDTKTDAQTDSEKQPKLQKGFESLLAKRGHDKKGKPILERITRTLFFHYESCTSFFFLPKNL